MVTYVEIHYHACHRKPSTYSSSYSARRIAPHLMLRELTRVLPPHEWTHPRSLRLPPRRNAMRWRRLRFDDVTRRSDDHRVMGIVALLRDYSGRTLVIAGDVDGGSWRRCRPSTVCSRSNRSLTTGLSGTLCGVLVFSRRGSAWE